jgi:hypothetical protein
MHDDDDLIEMRRRRLLVFLVDKHPDNKDRRLYCPRTVGCAFSQTRRATLSVLGLAGLFLGGWTARLFRRQK